jgi:ankyrin repeat protein
MTMNTNRLLSFSLALAFLPFVGCATQMVAAGDGGENSGSNGAATKAQSMQRQHGGADNGQGLLDAAARGDLQGVDSNLSQGSSVDSRSANGATPLQLAAAGGYLPVVQTLLAHGANVNAADANGLTALGAASAGNFEDVVRALKAAGAGGGSAPAAGGGQNWWQTK